MDAVRHQGRMSLLTQSRSGGGRGRLRGRRDSTDLQQIVQEPYDQRARILVEPRTISSGANVLSASGTLSPFTWACRDSTAAAAMACIGWRSVVSGGSVAVM